MIRIRKSDIENLNPKSIKILAFVFIVIALIFGLSSTYSRYNEEAKYYELKEGGCYTYGVIDDVDRSLNRKSRNKYHAYGTYIVDDQEYRFDFTSSTPLFEQSEILIYYEEGNPSNYIQNGFLKGSYSVGIFSIGVVLAMLGLILWLNYKEKQNVAGGGYSNVQASNPNYYTQPNEYKGNVGSTAFYKRKK